MVAGTSSGEKRPVNLEGVRTTVRFIVAGSCGKDKFGIRGCRAAMRIHGRGFVIKETNFQT